MKMHCTKYTILRYKTGSNLEKKYPAIAGQAFCNFLAQRYAEQAPRQILFQLRQGKTLARAIRLICKRPLDTLTAQCFAFYQQRSAAVSSGLGYPVTDTLTTFPGKKVQRSVAPDTV